VVLQMAQLGSGGLESSDHGRVERGSGWAGLAARVGREVDEYLPIALGREPARWRTA